MKKSQKWERNEKHLEKYEKKFEFHMKEYDK